MNILFYLKNRIALHKATRKAEKAHASDPKSQYFVVLNHKNKLIIISTGTFRYYKSKGIIHRRATIRDLYRECYYFTAGRGELNPITPDIKALKRKMYIHHMNQLKKQGH